MKKGTPPFVHLHVHTEYSMLDGVNRVPKMVQKVKGSGMNAIAITDHGVLYGAYELWKTCREVGIKPIIGCEIYVSPKEKELRQEVDGIKYYHLILLAKNIKGYHNLVKMVSIGHLKGFYYKPRVDREVLQEYSEGIICTSACPQGPLGKHILRNETKKAKEWLELLHKIYKGDFYLELQRHGLIGSDEVAKTAKARYGENQYRYMKEQSKINTQLRQWSRECNIPLIATTDAHYLDQDDELTQEVLFAIKDGKTLDDPSRRLPYKHTYVKTPEEVFETYSDIPEALENTQRLADLVDEYDITYDRVQPKYKDLPKGRTAKEELRAQAYKGAKEKYKRLTSKIKKRIDYEIDLIDKKGYSHYYLVTADYVRWARRENIVVSMRGTGTSSVVAYCIDITSIDPFQWDLMFERFLNPKRPSPPDFDLDLEDQNRDKVLDYVKRKYGEESVVAICTFGRMQSRAAIRDVCRVMGIDLKVADNLSKMVQVNFGNPKPIVWMMENNSEFASIVNSDPQLSEMVDVASKIEGIKRHLSTHACGVLITPKPATEYIAVQRELGGDRVITQADLNWIEEGGLMKFDFLGLANLTIIRNTIDLVNKLHNTSLTIDSIPFNDSKTFEIFQKGDTTSVFQFEGSGMRRFLKELKPVSLFDLCLLNALYRPGPIKYIPDAIAVKRGRKKPHYIVPELEPILEETYGVIVYQEQIMQIAVKIAGYKSYGDADLLRKAVAKKKHDVMEKEESKFKAGMLKNGYTKEQAEALWAFLVPFADYGFPKAHSAMYAVVAYWTAYLKAHYPLEFMCARLTADMDKPDKLIVALEEAKNLGLKLLPPDINKSYAEFVPEGESAIRYGLDGIKNVGRNIVEEITKEREQRGEFRSLDDFCARVNLMNARTLESLIKVGALNQFGEQSALLAVYPSVLAITNQEARKRSMGQLGIFSYGNSSSTRIRSTPMPKVVPVSTSQKLEWEKDLLGIYFTSHPIQEHLENLRLRGIDSLGDKRFEEGKDVRGACLIASLRTITTKNGDPMAFLTLEDLNTTTDAVLFPKGYQKFGRLLKKGNVVVVEGKCNRRNGELSIIVNKIATVMEDHADKKQGEGSKEVTLVISATATQNDLSQLKDILVENPGDVSVFIHIKNNGKAQKFRMKRKVSMEIIDSVVSKISMVEKVIIR